MKKLLITLIVSVVLLANDTQLAIKIYNSIAHECTKKVEAKIYLHGDLDILYNNKSINRTYDCADADFVITSTLLGLPSECNSKIIFSNKYRLFKQSNRVVGAFFWQKGRPNIIFDRERLQKSGIELSDNFQKYIE
ncbi:MAG: hypothetical protein U9P71_07875 [Campylobacterota bacterium]|nr:hypothetical protein [Campylobacterota bacterium]